jgi:hypothetical protein
MKTYKIFTTHTLHRVYKIEAESEESAKAKLWKTDPFGCSMINIDDRGESITKIERVDIPQETH